MHEIICPHCEKAFKIDEAGYADILKQVRDHEFEQQLHERLELAEQDKRNAVELATTKVTPQPLNFRVILCGCYLQFIHKFRLGKLGGSLLVMRCLLEFVRERVAFFFQGT